MANINTIIQWWPT